MKPRADQAGKEVRGVVKQKQQAKPHSPRPLNPKPLALNPLPLNPVHGPRP